MYYTFYWCIIGTFVVCAPGNNMEAVNNVIVNSMISSHQIGELMKDLVLQILNT